MTKFTEERLQFSDHLLTELDNIIGKLNPSQDLSDTIAYMELIKRKMQMRFFETNQTHILVQIRKMETIINRVREMQNKKDVTSM